MKYRPYKTDTQIANELLERACDEMMENPPRNVDLLREAAKRLSAVSLPDTSGATPDSPPKPGGVSPSSSGTYHFEIASINKHVVRAAVLQLVEAIEEFGLYTGPVCSELGIDGKAYITD
jgi:hypothetical protein